MQAVFYSCKKLTLSYQTEIMTSIHTIIKSIGMPGVVIFAIISFTVLNSGIIKFVVELGNFLMLDRGYGYLVPGAGADVNLILLKLRSSYC
jgi:hypothetical protein